MSSCNKIGLMAGAALCAMVLSGCGSGLSVGTSAGLGGGSSAGLAGGSASFAPAEPVGTADAGAGAGGSGAGAGGGATGSASGGTGAAGGPGSASSGVTPVSTLGSGAVMVTAGGTTVTTPSAPSNPATNAVTGRANNAADNLVTTGNALLPAGVSSALQGATAGVPASGNVANNSLGGSPTQPVGVSVLSTQAASGTIASANVLSAGQTGAVTINPAGATGGLPLTTNIAGTTLTGGAGTQPLAVSALAPTTATGSVATLGVLSGGNIVTANVTGAGPTPLPGTTGALAGTAGSVLNGSASLANGTVANQNILTGNNPLIGASALSRGQNTGSVATVGAIAGGQAATVGVGGRTVATLGR
jgi:hypothetical protein